MLSSDEKGQAATEFTIAAAFVLVPLFLIVPLLGKYIDIRHAAIQHARFSAWEYTVWQGKEDTYMTDIKSSESAGKKAYEDTIGQGVEFFFADPTAADYGTSRISTGINPLWQDHRSKTLLHSGAVKTTIKEHKTPVPVGEIGKIFEELFQFLGDVLSLIGELLNLVGVDARFDAINTDGYFRSAVDVEVRSLGQILPRLTDAGEHVGEKVAPLTFKAKAAVQTNNWNSGSTRNATAESRGLVVTSLLAPVSNPVNKVIAKVNSILGKIPLLEVKFPAMPEFGYVKDDLIPYEHIEGNSKKLQSKQGLYSYEDK
ncbi:MAG TPA: hypothetical protein VJ969_08810 [Desulfopila sp.]|nr:hypothetical protein [Desulfopila sp.]